MKTTIILSILLLLHLLFHGCKGSSGTSVFNQYDYAYSAENFGYIDIQKLYSSDSLTKNTPFFSSQSLQHLEMTITVDLKKTVLKQSKDSLLICYQLANPKLDIKTEGVSMQLDAILKDLIKPVFVSTTKHSKIGLLKFDTGVSETAVGLYKDMLSRMQFVKPPRQSKTWQATEENPQGTYVAEYQLETTDSSNIRYTKNVVDYLTYTSKKENQESLIDNNTTIETDAFGGLKRIYTSEAQIMLQYKDTLSVLGSKVSIFLSSEKKIKNDVVQQLLVLEKSKKYSQNTTLSEGVSDEDIRKMSYQETLAADTWETLIQKLSAMNDLKKALDENLDLKFRALFYLQPTYCNTAVSYLNNHLEHTIAFKVLSTALAITETPSATNAIAMLLEKNKGNEDLMRILIPVLTTTEYPTPLAIKVLKSIAFGPEESQGYFIKSTTQLALGGMANQLRSSDSLQAEKLTLYLMEKMKFKKDTIQHILVLGNTGSPKIFPFIKSLVEHSKTSEQAKVEAIAALQLVPGKSVSTYLQKMTQHENAAIRQKAVEVIEYQRNRREE